MNRLPESDALYVRDVVMIALRGWWAIALTTALAVVLTSIWMAVVEPKHSAEMTVAPTGIDPAQSLGALSAVARFAGIAGTVAEEIPKYVRFRQALVSTVLAERLEERHQILRRAFENRWDSETSSWLPPSGPLDRLKGIVNPWFGLPAWSEPSAETLVEYLKEEITVSEVADTAMLELSFSHENPDFASDLLKWLHTETDELLREEAGEKARNQVAYASERLASVTVSDYREMMLSVLAEEEKKLLLIEAAGPFAALVVDPPTVSAEPTFPQPVLFLIAAIFLGACTGTVFVFTWHAFFAPISKAPPAPAISLAASKDSVEQERGTG